MQINSHNKAYQNNSPNFGLKFIKPNQLNKAPYASIPLALSALASLGMAKLAIDREAKTEKLPTPEEFEQMLQGLKNDLNTDLLGKWEIYRLVEKYKESPEITLKIVNLKSSDGKRIFNYYYDMERSIEAYKLHPEFSELVIEEVQKTEKSKAHNFAIYLIIDSEDSDLLYQFYNRRDPQSDSAINPCGLTISGYGAPEILKAYKKYPDLCQQLLNDKDEKGNYNYHAHAIEKICQAYEIEPELTLELLNVTDECGYNLGSSIHQIVTWERDIKDFYINTIRKQPKNNCFARPYDFEQIYNIKKSNPELIEKALSIKNVKGQQAFDLDSIFYINELDKEVQDLAIEIISKGYPVKDLKNIFKGDIKTAYKLLNKGIIPNRLKSFHRIKSPKEILAETEKPETPMSKFLETSDYMAKIKEFSAGKYQKELMQLFEPDKIPYALSSRLMHSELSVEDFLLALRKISKSSFKLAYDTPNQYLTGLSMNLSTPVNGHYPKLNSIELEKERSIVLDFFINNFTSLARLLKYVDNDTVNHLMDKRFEIFTQELETMNKVSKERMELLNQLLQCKSEKTEKPLTVKEKLQVYEIVKIFHLAKISNEYFEKAIKKGFVNTDEFKEIITKEILKKAGIDPKEAKTTNLKFNKEYSHLLLTSSLRDLISNDENIDNTANIQSHILPARNNECILQERKSELEDILTELDPNDEGHIKLIKNIKELLVMFDNIEKYSDNVLLEKYLDCYYRYADLHSNNDKVYSLIKGVSTGDFKGYIHNPENEYGIANLKTKEIFREKELNHEEWINPSIKTAEFEVAGKILSMKLWGRNPLEDLFMGNKTTCCTAIGRTNGGATPVYIMGECWNVVQLLDEKGNLVGMSRIFIGENNGECAIMMDNIELNNNFIKNMTTEEKVEIRNHFFKYIQQYAEKVIGKTDAKVYFYRKDTHVDTSDLEEIDLDIDFIGKNPTKSIYINSAGMRWINPEKLKEKPTEWFITPKQ